MLLVCLSKNVMLVCLNKNVMLICLNKNVMLICLNKKTLKSTVIKHYNPYNIEMYCTIVHMLCMRVYTDLS